MASAHEARLCRNRLVVLGGQSAAHLYNTRPCALGILWGGKKRSAAQTYSKYFGLEYSMYLPELCIRAIPSIFF